MQQALQIGLTGGIGAGKSTVARIFEMLNIPVYYADQRARKLMEEDPQLRSDIQYLLGSQAFDDDHRLNRKWIATQVFSDHDLLTRLNYLVHPKVKRDSDRWHTNHLQQPYTLKEAALTYESGQYLTLDAVISVEAPKELRIERVMHRDRVRQSDVEARMMHQWPGYRRRQVADFIIENNAERLLIPQVIHIHRTLLLMQRS